MMGDRAKNLKVTVHNVSELKYKETKLVYNAKKDDYDVIDEIAYGRGDCRWIDKNDRPNEYVIRVKKGLRRASLMVTLFHECRHIEQFKSGRLKDYWTTTTPIYIPYKSKMGRNLFWVACPSLIRWKRSVYRDELTEYKSAPWEKDARKWERKLSKAYKEHLKKVGLTF